MGNSWRKDGDPNRVAVQEIGDEHLVCYIHGRYFDEIAQIVTIAGLAPRGLAVTPLVVKGDIDGHECILFSLAHGVVPFHTDTIWL